METDISYQGCDLSVVPGPLSTVGNAARVDLSRNKLADIRPLEFRIQGVVDLNVSFNCFVSVPGALSCLTSLTRLCMNSNKLTDGMPAMLAPLPLQRLEVANNKISRFASSLTHLTELTALDLSANEIREVPSQIQCLVNLQLVDISSNHISAIHRDISKCSRLQVLLVRNRMCSFFVCYLSHSLYCVRLLCKQASNNQLETYTCSLCALHHLEVLDLSHNRIVALQGRLYEWTSLRRLNISNNSLSVIPSALGWLELEELEVHGNPGLAVPQQVLSARGSQLHAIRAYLQIICEQHRLIDKHLTQFNTKPGQHLPSNFVLAGGCFCDLCL